MLKKVRLAKSKEFLCLTESGGLLNLVFGNKKNDQVYLTGSSTESSFGHQNTKADHGDGVYSRSVVEKKNFF